MPCRQLAHIGQLRIEDEEEEVEWVDPSGGLLVNIFAACEVGDTEKLAVNVSDLQQTEHSIDTPGAFVFNTPGAQWGQYPSGCFAIGDAKQRQRRGPHPCNPAATVEQQPCIPHAVSGSSLTAAPSTLSLLQGWVGCAAGAPLLWSRATSCAADGPLLVS
jgi:hypothetical protein